jgi:hypothetical protein
MAHRNQPLGKSFVPKPKNRASGGSSIYASMPVAAVTTVAVVPAAATTPKTEARAAAVALSKPAGKKRKEASGGLPEGWKKVPSVTNPGRFS